MMRSFFKILGCVVFVLFSSYSFSQVGEAKETKEKITVSGNDLNKSFTFNGNVVEVSGNNHVVTIKGSASRVDVSGTNNTLYIDKVNKAVVTGVNNKVFYKTSDNKTKKAVVTMDGVENSVRKQ